MLKVIDYKVVTELRDVKISMGKIVIQLYPGDEWFQPDFSSTGGNLYNSLFWLCIDYCMFTVVTWPYIDNVNGITLFRHDKNRQTMQKNYLKKFLL